MNNNEIQDLKEEFFQLNQKLDFLISSNFQKKAPTDDEIEDTISITAAALILGRSVSTVYSKSSKGEIPSWNDGGRLCFSKKKLIEWKRQNEKKVKDSPINRMIKIHERYQK